MSAVPPRRDSRRDKKILLISQVYEPDPAAVGQYMADAAAGLVELGFRVLVFTSNRGYDAPGRKYVRRERIDGVDIRRFPLSSFGKRNLAVRLIAQLFFLFQCVIHGLLTRSLAGVLVTTVPPMAGGAGLIISVLRRAPLRYWVMDINPDQVVELGEVEPGSVLVRTFEWMNGRVLRRADAVVTLDRFMADRLSRKSPISEKLTIAPPWPLENHLEPVDHEQNPFRRQNGLTDKLVVMYSGNHALVHPLTTILDVAEQLAHRDDLVFVFIGGGVGKREVENAILSGAMPNAVSLPYQSLERLRFSLSAGDLHVVTMGENMVGCVHPSKVYAAMSVARPVLFVGPLTSPLGELLDRYGNGWGFRPDDAAGIVELLVWLLDGHRSELIERGRRGREAISRDLSRDAIRAAVLEAVGGGLD